MNCKKAKEQINKLFDGFEIKDEYVLSHIKSCRKCLNEYNAVLKIKNALNTKEKIKAPYDFNNRVWNKIGEPRPSVFDFMNKLLILKPAFAAAITLVLFFVLLCVYNIKDNLFNVKKDNIVYNINKEDISDKKTIASEIKQVEKHEIKVSEINRPPQQENNSSEEKEKQIVIKDKSKKEEVVYNTYIHQPEDIKSGKVTGEKIAVAEVKKEPNKIETSDIRYLREDYKIFNNIINPIKGEKVLIRYKIQNQCQVKIIIYDRNGELVRELVNENKNTGVYEATWDGRDAKGNISGAGIYYIYLKTDIVEKKIKTLVIK
ncbi:MAG: hypothetical protein N3E50_00820 [Candidatus Goldbacteria bacterium]|nr:hypothetical protein [Candidatus Goldiibacteriota bacterium]